MCRQALLVQGVLHEVEIPALDKWSRIHRDFYRRFRVGDDPNGPTFDVPSIPARNYGLVAACGKTVRFYSQHDLSCNVVVTGLREIGPDEPPEVLPQVIPTSKMFRQMSKGVR